MTIPLVHVYEILKTLSRKLSYPILTSHKCCMLTAKSFESGNKILYTVLPKRFVFVVQMQQVIAIQWMVCFPVKAI